MYYASGKVEKRNYEKGELNGPATITWPSGDVFEFSYNAGKMEVRTTPNNTERQFMGKAGWLL